MTMDFSIALWAVTPAWTPAGLIEEFLSFRTLGAGDAAHEFVSVDSYGIRNDLD
jgi:hypothetical protein